MAVDQLDIQDSFGFGSQRFTTKRKQDLDAVYPEMDLEIADYESICTANLRVHIMAGAAAGILEHCVMYPVDSIKTRMQSLRPDPNAIYKGVTDAFGKIFRQEGFFRPFRGLNVVALGAGPAHALYFSSYEAMKKLLGNGGTGHHPLANGLAGATATLFHDGTMNPVEVIKQRMQMYGSPYKGVTHCFKTILKNEGPKAFYRSFTTQLTMNIPFQCTHFVTYEFFRESMNPSGGYDPKTHLVAGATAGAVAAALTTPLDVAKTLLNTQEKCAVAEMKAVTCGETRTFITGMFSALRTVYRLQGFPGYFQGLRARVIYQTPSCAISWSVYEFFKHFLTLTPEQEKEWMENAI